MTATAQKKVEEIMKCLYADGYFRVQDWNGCEVYSPKYNRRTCIGAPWVVFVCGDDARRATRDESFEYLRYRKELAESKNDTGNVG